MKPIRIGPSFERRPKKPEQRELRIQSGGNPLRVFYAFDPRRSAILLIRGEQPRDGDWMDIEQAGSGIPRWSAASNRVSLRGTMAKAKTRGRTQGRPLSGRSS